MIYTRFNAAVEIIRYIGMDTGRTGFGQEVYGEWVKVRFFDRPIGLNQTRDIMISDLIADGGLAEIQMAILVADAPYEPDGTHNEFSVEWRYRCAPGEDWLEKAQAYRDGAPIQLQPHESLAEWAAAVLNSQGRWADADQAYWSELREQAAYENDPLLRERVAISDAMMQTGINIAEAKRRVGHVS